MKHDLTIEGMSCQHCVRAVQEALESANVTVDSVSIGRATIEAAADAVDTARAAIEDDGYKVVRVEATSAG